MLLLYKDEIIQKIYEGYPRIDDNLVELIVYGSVARGDYTPNSDIDLLLITKDKRKTKELFSDFRANLFAKFGILISAIYVSQDDFYFSFNPLYETIKKEGITVWKREMN